MGPKDERMQFLELKKEEFIDKYKNTPNRLIKDSLTEETPLVDIAVAGFDGRVTPYCGWLQRPHALLGDRTPLDFLMEGDIDSVRLVLLADVRAEVLV